MDAARLIANSGTLFSTDPPYYDNISYADFSDFFYIWLRRSMRRIFPAEFATLLTPKADELVATPYRFTNGKKEAEQFFINGMRRVVDHMAQTSWNGAPLAMYYAFKQAEIEKEGIASTGWATFLEAVIEAGFQVDGTWPIRTELAIG